MKKNSLVLGLILVNLFAGPGPVRAQDKPTAEKKAAPTPTPPPPVRRVVVFRAAAGAVPAARVTGGSRGAGDAAVRLDVLAPDETGLTTQEQPSLFWYQSKPSQAPLEITLLEKNKAKPLLQVKREHADRAGIQRLRLSDHGVKLQPGVEYRWVVAIMLDPENRSGDLIASGFIKRVEPSSELRQKLAAAAPSDIPIIYADAGIWHDALSAISDLIQKGPDADTWRAQRADLLKQVKLDIPMEKSSE